jgi:hypothetical protein
VAAKRDDTWTGESKTGVARIRKVSKIKFQIFGGLWLKFLVEVTNVDKNKARIALRNKKFKEL